MPYKGSILVVCFIYGTCGTVQLLSIFIIEFVVVVIYWTECMPRKFGNEIRLLGTTGIDNLPIPLRGLSQIIFPTVSVIMTLRGGGGLGV